MTLSECKRRFEAQNFPLFPGQISGEVSIGYDEACGLRQGLLCPAMSLESMGKRRTSGLEK